MDGSGIAPTGSILKLSIPTPVSLVLVIVVPAVMLDTAALPVSLVTNIVAALAGTAASKSPAISSEPAVIDESLLMGRGRKL